MITSPPAPPPANELANPRPSPRVGGPGIITAPGDHIRPDTQEWLVSGGALSPAPPPAISLTTPNERSRVEEYGILNAPLLALADPLNDVEHLRGATENRAESLRKRGRIREALYQESLAKKMRALETELVKDLERAMKKHPLYPWVERNNGIGKKQAARLLAAVDNPYWNAKANRPRRGPAELWAYCGYHVLPAASHSGLDAHTAPAGGGHPPHPTDHGYVETHAIPVGGVDPSPATSQEDTDTLGSAAGGGRPSRPTDPNRSDAYGSIVGGVAPRHRKGQRSNWNSQAQSRARVIADQCILTVDYDRIDCLGRHQKQTASPYRAPYEAYKARLTATRPELSAGHVDNMARRYLAKQILKDLFLEAKRWHEEPD